MTRCKPRAATTVAADLIGTDDLGQLAPASRRRHRRRRRPRRHRGDGQVQFVMKAGSVFRHGGGCAGVTGADVRAVADKPVQGSWRYAEGRHPTGSCGGRSCGCCGRLQPVRRDLPRDGSPTLWRRPPRSRGRRTASPTSRSTSTATGRRCGPCSSTHADPGVEGSKTGGYYRHDFVRTLEGWKSEHLIEAYLVLNAWRLTTVRSGRRPGRRVALSQLAEMPVNEGPGCRRRRRRRGRSAADGQREGGG